MGVKMLHRRKDDPESGDIYINDYEWVKITSYMFKMLQNVTVSNIVNYFI